MKLSGRWWGNGPELFQRLGAFGRYGGLFNSVLFRGGAVVAAQLGGGRCAFFLTLSVLLPCIKSGKSWRAEPTTSHPTAQNRLPLIIVSVGARRLGLNKAAGSGEKILGVVVSDYERPRGRRFAGVLQTVSETMTATQQGFNQGQPFRVVSGECRKFRRFGAGWAFDLAATEGTMPHVLTCRISVKQTRTINSYLRQFELSIEEAMKVGIVLEVKGKLGLTGAGNLFMDVEKIAESFTFNGPMYLQDKSTLDKLRQEKRPPARLNGAAIHCGQVGYYPEFPAALKTILVLAPKDSEGLSDFKGEVRGIERHVCVTYKTLQQSSVDATEVIASTFSEAAETGYDLIFIVRGGGSWNSLRAYDHPSIALAIARSEVPVATAIGYRNNTSMSDRAACYSFTTPSAAGKALSTTVWKRTNAGAIDSSRPAAVSKKRWDEQSGSSWTKQWTTLLHLEDQLAASRKEMILARTAAEESVFLVHQAFRTHNQDLLEFADARVRWISRVVSVFTLVVDVLLAAYLATTAHFLGFSPSGLQRAITLGLAVVSWVAVLWWQDKLRKAMYRPSVRPMKHPPADAIAWRAMSKRVRSPRGLRHVRRYMPISG